MNTPNHTPSRLTFALTLGSLLTAMGMAGTATAGDGEAIGVSAALDGVPYRIDIPANHNGDLVLLFHGYEPKGIPRDQPWPGVGAAQAFIAAGYAVAASAYRDQGWVVAEGLRDSQALLAHYIRTHGRPAHVYAAGFSMGGHMALAAAEAQPEAFTGVLSLCGVNASAPEVFDAGILASLVALETLFPGQLPADGLFDPTGPVMLDAAALEAAFKSDEDTAGLLARQTSIPREGLAGSLGLRYLILRDVAARAGGIPVDNWDDHYQGFGDDADFNARVPRYTGDPKAMRWLSENAVLTGAAPRPVLLFNNRIDPTVSPPYHLRYQQMAQAQGRGAQIALWPVEGERHCAFSPPAIAAAMRHLDDWAERGIHPSVPR